MANFDIINEILKNYSKFGFFYGNSIPANKLKAALDNYVIGSPQIFALYDATLFGSAKEGACFTQDTIYYKSGSTIGTIKYDEILSATIEDKKFNGRYCSIFIWCPGLIEDIKKSNPPIDLTNARKSISKGAYAQAIKELDQQKKYVPNTPIDDIVIYKYMYIKANLGLKNYSKAEELLKAFTNQFHGNKASSLAAEAETHITEYKNRYEQDIKALDNIIEECSILRSEKKFKEAIEKLKAVVLREDFTKIVKCNYYKNLITTYIIAEMPDAAEITINKIYQNNLITPHEKTALDKQICELRETLRLKVFQKQKDIITKHIETAKMYEKYGIYESASDTILAALSDAPTELKEERITLFKMLTDMLLSQYEYDDLYAIGKQYSDIASSDKLGYSLSNRIEDHKATHKEEHFNHLYNDLLYYMQNGKYERAQRSLNNAKKIKSTFDLRCSEVNLAILKLDYTKSRSLIDELIADKDIFNSYSFSDTIAQLEFQYKNMILTISNMLKSYALSNNIEALMAKEGYKGFVDNDGLNLPCIASRYANHNILYSLLDYGYGYKFRRTNEGFGIAFLAAMQLDYPAFYEFINARMDSFDGYINCILNEKINYSFAISEVTREIRSSQNIGEIEARNISIRSAYSEAILLMAVLLDDTKKNTILNMLSERKILQEKLFVKMREILPNELQRIDYETKEKCSNLNTASSELTSLITNNLDDKDNYKLNSVIEELNTAVKKANNFAQENAENKKAAKIAALKKEEDFITTIQSRIDAFKAIDNSEIISLLDIPADAIKLGEYNEENQTLSFTLGCQSVEIKMNSQFAALIISRSNKIQIAKNIQNSFEGNALTIIYTYTYSDSVNSCTVSFTKKTYINDSLTEEKFINRILGILKY